MPVTAKLSKQFYDRLGEQVTNELVEWFNQVDATYKSDVRELNDANRAWMRQQFAAQEAWLDQRFAAQEARIEARFAAQDARIEQLFAIQDAKWEARFAALELRVERALKEQTRFLYVALAAQVLLILGLYTR